MAGGNRLNLAWIGVEDGRERGSLTRDCDAIVTNKKKPWPDTSRIAADETVAISKEPCEDVAAIEVLRRPAKNAREVKLPRDFRREH